MPANMPNFAVNEIAQYLEHLWSKIQDGELTLVCGGQKLKIHRVALLSRSEFFRAGFDGAFLEGQTKEMTLPDDEPQYIVRMILHCYGKSYDVSDSEITMEGIPFAITVHSQMFALGDKYAMNALKDEAAWKLDEVLKSAACVNLGLEAIKPETLSIIDNMHPNTARSLRDPVVAFITERLTSRGMSEARQPFLELSSSHAPRLLSDVFLSILNENDNREDEELRKRKRNCPSRGNMPYYQLGASSFSYDDSSDD